jgi:tRNA-2-methylthio-N6-dimethylallyladenosine synthase
LSETIVLEDANGIASPTRESTPSAFIRSFGCQMNVYDSERMGDLAAKAGYREAIGVEDADLIVLTRATSGNAPRRKSIPSWGSFAS